MKSIPLLILFLISSSLFAQEFIPSSRYTDVNTSATLAQKDPLSVIVNFSFPRNIENVGDALYLISTPSGYRFSLEEDDVAYILFEMPLPEVHKQLGPISLRNAIEILSGSGFEPVFDDATRLISFKATSDSIRILDANDFKKSWLERHSHKVTRNNSLGEQAVFQDESNILEKIDGEFTEYEVVFGDSISKIASKLGLAFTSLLVDEMLALNGHAFLNQNPNLLLEGQTIKVPYL